MLRSLLIVSAMVVSVLMFACSSASEPAALPQDRIDPNTASSLRFMCEDGVLFEVRFLGPETLLLTLAKHEYILMREPTASGAAYSAQGITFWNKGPQALLLIDDMKVQCQKSG
ncbi:MAG: MliC family protein [Proteobacteria bacterium]|nr:MliC family protein [Pseudomonadota bacterium]